VEKDDSKYLDDHARNKNG